MSRFGRLFSRARMRLTRKGPSKLAFQLTEKNIPADKIWFEVKSRSPRIREGQTVLDLALGDIMLRKDTASGIELAAGGKGNIVFCEFKWYSDIDNRVSYDLHRNQLARVIENALLFRSANGRFAEQVHVCLEPISKLRTAVDPI